MSRQSGSVLFLILLAVALFAALSYAVTSSSQGSTKSATREKAQASAARLMNFATSMRVGIARIKAVNGVDITGVNFANDVYKTGLGVVSNPMGSPSNPNSYLFHPQGGAVVPLLFEDITTPISTSNTQSGHASFTWMNVPQVGTTASDATMSINGISDDVCQDINSSMGLDFIPVITANNGGNMTAYTSKTEATGATTNDLDAIRGKAMFCYKQSSGTLRNVYTEVLEIR